MKRKKVVLLTIEKDLETGRTSIIENKNAKNYTADILNSLSIAIGYKIRQRYKSDYTRSELLQKICSIIESTMNQDKK